MSASRAALPVVALLLSGCSMFGGGGPSCPDDDLRVEAYEDAEEFSEGLLVDVPATIRLQGTVEGERGTFLIAFDPDDEEMRVSTPDLEVRVAGIHYSIDGSMEGESASFVARNHEPGAAFALFADMGDLGEEEPSFADDLTVGDYEAECSELGDGTQVIEYTYQDDEGNRDTVVVERDGQHRPLSGHVVDTVLDDSYRASISYEDPEVEVDETLPRLPFTYAFDETTGFEPTERGSIVDAGFGPGTEWVPVGEVEMHLVNTTTGQVMASGPLEEGEHALGAEDGYEYTDADGNGLLSTGDRLVLDLAWDRDVQFYDLWAEEYAFTALDGMDDL